MAGEAVEDPFGQQASFELAAYTVELNCLLEQRKKQNCDKCSPYVNGQIDFIKKTQLPHWNNQLSPKTPKINF
jgi:hypothetical protein